MSDFLNLLIDTEWLHAQFDAHPRDMWTFTIFAFLLGFVAGTTASKLIGRMRKRRTFNELDERERWMLAHAMQVSPKKWSVSGDIYVPCCEMLVRAGILASLGIEERANGVWHVYAIEIGWRGWLKKHKDELPDWNADMPE